MRTKAIILTIAVFFGLVASYMVSSYVSSMKKQFIADSEKAEVLMAVGEIPVGMTLDEIKARKLAKVKKVPREFISSGAIDGDGDMSDKVIAVSLLKGEQLTSNKFKTPSQAGLAFMIPENYVALSIPIDDVKGVSDMIKIGDFVNVIATFTEGDSITKTVMQRVRVLAVGEETEREQSVSEPVKGIANASTRDEQSTVTKKTVTLAVTQGDAEKIVFSEEEGNVWLTLLPSPDAQPVSTPGQSIQTVFK